MLANVMSMRRSVQERPEDKHIQRSLENRHVSLRLFSGRSHSTLIFELMVDVRLSFVKTDRIKSILE
jgi:hypothetical protein